MRKSTIFISAVLTTFALVTLYRVIAAYNDSKPAVQAAAVAAIPASTPVPVATDLLIAPTPTDTVLGPVDAAQVAAKVIGKTDILSAETSSYNGVNAYLITFTDNDVVYVGTDGQILSVQIAPVTPAAVTPVVVNVPAPITKQNSKKHTSNSSGGHEGGGEHEGGDD